MKNQSTNHADIVATFDGFTGFTCREDWPLIAAFIDNLAEFKVVEWLFRNVWDGWMEMTMEHFMHGYCDEEGFRIDCGTGLSKPSVIAGIRRAIEHGLIEVDIDATDPTHIRKFYRMRIADVTPLYITDEQEYADAQDFYPGDEEICAQTDEFYPDFEQEETFFTPSKELELSTQSNNYMDVFRNQEEVNNSNSDKTVLPCGRLQMLSREDNATLCNRLESLSSDLGDLEHTASNIGQARRILARYLASGGDFETFLLLMQQAKEITQKKSGIKHRNNKKQRNAMPYYFAVLRRATVVAGDC